MGEVFQFSNMDPAFEEVLIDETTELLRKFKKELNVKANFSLDNNGLYHGMMSMDSHWGRIHASSSSRNLFKMVKQLKRKAGAQLNKKRSQSKFSGRGTGVRYDSMEIIDNQHPIDLPRRNDIYATSTEVNFGGYPDPLIMDPRTPQKLNVLVIDDDVDALLPVDQTLRKLSCLTDFAIESKDATKKITSGKIDLIILDWYVDSQNGAEILEKSIHIIEKFETLKQQVLMRKPKVITYSGLSSDKIYIPDTDYFEHLGHWEKPLKPKDIALKASQLLYQLGA